MKVSIIMATWNRGDLIHIPIESVLAQTYEDWDFWIMDDASTDNTQDVVRTYHDNRIHYVQLDKQPYYTVVRNKGIEMSGGELLAFRDSDGAWHESFLEELVKPHRNPDVLITYCGRLGFKDVDLTKIRFKDIKDLTPTHRINPVVYTGRDSVSNSIDVGDFVLKRKAFSHKEFQGFDEKKDVQGYCSDAKLVDNIERFNKHAKYVAIDKPLHYYFLNHGGKVENMTLTKIRYRSEGKQNNELESLWEF